jgi:hypothetical protein
VDGHFECCASALPTRIADLPSRVLVLLRRALQSIQPKYLTSRLMIHGDLLSHVTPRPDLAPAHLI